MRWTALAALGMLCTATADAQPPLNDTVALNIGLNCQWQDRCMAKQKKAMRRALSYVQKKRPAAWRIQLCNHNAGKTRYRVDWVGFNNCIRNADLRPLPPRPLKKKPRRITQTGSSRSLGERG